MQRIEPIRFLSPEEMQRIHEAAKHILERVGIKVESAVAREYLAGAGCLVDNDSCLVRFPESLVEENVARMRAQYSNPQRVPRRMGVRYSQIQFTGSEFRVHPDFSLSAGGFCCFAAGLDGGKRLATLDDTRAALRLANALPEITFTGIPCAAQDVPLSLRPIKMAAELAKATRKFGGVEVFNLFDIEYVTRIAAVVAGGEEQLKRNPIMVGYGEARSPLCLDAVMSDIFIEYIRRGMPQSLDTMPCSGTTAPGSIAGTLVQGIAETLAGLCLGYAVDNDATLAVDIVPSFPDKRSMLFSYGSIFRQRWIACRVQMISEFYGCPSGIHGSKTDSCFHDIQAGVEKATSILMPVLAGAIGIGTAGHLENALTFSPAQLVIDAEIARCVRRMLRGVEVTDRTLALDLIERVGPNGSFLVDDDNLDLMMDELDHSDLFACQPWDVAHGPDHRDIATRASEIAEELISLEPEPVLTAGQVEEIDGIVEEAAGRLGVATIA